MLWAKNRRSIVRCLGDRIGANVSIFAYLADTTNKNDKFVESAHAMPQYRLRVTITLKPYSTYKKQV